MPKKTWTARLTAELKDIPPLLTRLEKIGWRVLALIGCASAISLSILGAIDLVVKVWKVR